MPDDLTLDVAGRGSLTASAGTGPVYATVRIDDDDRPEFWAEVRLDEAQLQTLLDGVRAARNDR